MKITILGSGTCASHFGESGEARFPPGYIISLSSTKILLDCSEGVRFRLEKIGVDFASIKHLAISHAHPDHCALIQFHQSQFCKGLFGGASFKNEVLNVYCPNQIKDDFDNLWNFHHPDWLGERYPFPKLVFVGLSGQEDTIKYLNIEKARLGAASVKHGRADKVDALGFVVEENGLKLAYSGDSRDCLGLRKLAEGADLFLCEATGRPGQEEIAKQVGHLTPYEAGRISKEVGVKKLVLTHYSGMDTEQQMIDDCKNSEFAGDIVVAKDFMELEIC